MASSLVSASYPSSVLATLAWLLPAREIAEVLQPIKSTYQILQAKNTKNKQNASAFSLQDMWNTLGQVNF